MSEFETGLKTLEAIEKPKYEGKHLRFSTDAKGSKHSTAGDAYAERLDRIAKEAREQASERRAGLRIDDDVSLAVTNLAPTFGELRSPARSKISKARKAMHEGLYSDALELLDSALELDPREHDAHLLRGRCLNYLDRPRDALEALLPLASSDVPRRLQRKARVLRSDIRLVFAPGQAEDVQRQLSNGEVDEAVRGMRSLVELDPDSSLFSLLLSRSLQEAGQAVEALDVIDGGMAREHIDDRDSMAEVRPLALDLAARSSLVVAARLLLAGKQGEVSAALSSVDQRVRASTLAEQLLLLAEGGGVRTSSASAHIDRRPVASAREFVASVGVDDAEDMLRRGELEDAERAVRTALTFAPQLGDGMQALARVLYERFLHEMEEPSEGRPDFDALRVLLDEAKARASDASRASPGSDADELLATIVTETERFDAFVHDTEILDEVMSKVMTGLLLGLKGVGSRGDVDRIAIAFRGALALAKNRGPELSDPRAQKNLEGMCGFARSILDGAVVRAYQVIEEVERVDELFKRLKERMDDVPRRPVGIKNDVGRFLQEARNLERTLETEEGRKQAGMLTKSIAELFGKIPSL